MIMRRRGAHLHAAVRNPRTERRPALARAGLSDMILVTPNAFTLHRGQPALELTGDRRTRRLLKSSRARWTSSEQFFPL